MKDQSLLNTYFSTEWSSKIADFRYSGPTLVSKIAVGEWVLDVGCGGNYFKGKIQNLVGIDPARDEADFKVTLEDFQYPRKFDVAFCLGSINFGNFVDISNQITKLVTHLTPTARIYWRCNPGLQDHNTDGCKHIQFFSWSRSWHDFFAKAHGFNVAFTAWDTNNRLYVEWTR